METTRRVAVADASPVIALTSVNLLHLLGRLFSRVLVPSSVWDEVNAHPDAPEALALRQLKEFQLTPDSTDVPQQLRRLGRGEQHAIAVALSLGNAWLILDDGEARTAAARLGLRHIGTIGIIAAATRTQLIPQARPVYQRLVDRGFRIDIRVVNDALTELGEEPIEGL